MSPVTPSAPHLIAAVEPRPARIRTRSRPPSRPQSPTLIIGRPPNELVVSRARLRRYQPRHREHLLQSIKRWGIVQPILVDAFSHVIAGHQILAAALELGLTTVPTIALERIPDAEARALRILLNKLPELSNWDPVALKNELVFVADFDIDLATCTGFSSAELDLVFNSAEDDRDEPLPIQPQQPVSQLGDIWTFEGGHRLGCLDALCNQSFSTLLAGSLAKLVVCDPPYNVPIVGHVTRRPGAREFAAASGEMSPAAFTAFLQDVFELLSAHAEEGSLSLQFMDWRHMREMLDAGYAVYTQLLNLAVWAKTNPGMGSLWRSGHELCFIWKKGTASHVNNVELGRNGRNRSNVWSYPGANGFARGKNRDGFQHVTPKNVAMIQDAILDVSRRGDIVLDAFAGSGTTLVAAHRSKRRGRGLEIDPLYVDLAVLRLERCTRAPARHAETGLTFAEMADQRGIALPPRSRRA